MTKNERERAIQEGHKIHAETSYFTPRPQLDFVNARYVFCEGFDRGYIAATTEANKRMAELQVSNKRLRDGIAEIAVESQDTYTNAALTKLLSATPDESLQEKYNEALEKTANIAIKTLRPDLGIAVAEQLRSQKEVK